MFGPLEEGTKVASGKHVVPKGVAVEELGGPKKLLNECPASVTELLEQKNLTEVYESMVSRIVEESHTRGFFGKWKDEEVTEVVDAYKSKFEEGGLKVVFCTRTSSNGTSRWMEYFDPAVVTPYVPQYDRSNRSEDVLKTLYSTLHFPNGVVFEELSQWRSEDLKNKCPESVAALLEKKDLVHEYNNFVDECYNEGTGALKGYDVKKLRPIVIKHRSIFEMKGVSIYVSVKQEYMSTGQYGGTCVTHRWIEYVDRELQPNYYPQRDAENKGDCDVS